MDGTDLERVVRGTTQTAPLRAGLAALWRRQRPPAGATAADCLRAGRRPAPLFEPQRRALGQAGAAWRKAMR